MKSLSDVRILVVEDSPELLASYSGLLEHFGLSVTGAENGQVAWNLLQGQEFDIVLSDIRMPLMDGVELLKKIRARHSTSPCVLMTSGYSDYPAETLFELGASGFIAKPFNSISIRDALTRGLLRRVDMWKTPPSIAAEYKITKEFASFDEMCASHEVSFGNGGFFVHQSNPAAPLNSTISFSFTFETKPEFEKIEGSGLVKWAHIVESGNLRKGYGIEIKHLSDQCREPLFNWLEKQNFTSFIPQA